MIKDFVSLFFPKVCLTCGDALSKGLDELCIDCLKTLPKTDNHIINVPEFEQKFAGLIEIRNIWVYLFFQKRGIVQKLLHELKYNDRPDIGEMLGRWYGMELLMHGFDNQVDFVVPVPLHKLKQKSRGYNQSAHFAIGLAEAMKIPVEPDGLVRIKAGETQTNKSRFERSENVEGVFEVSKNLILEDKNVLLVDDVLTTGATLIAAASSLQNAGAQSINLGLIAAVK